MLDNKAGLRYTYTYLILKFMVSLNDLLAQRKCVKLVCGAGNEDPVEVEKLVAVYAKAGVHFFDLSANADVVKAAQRGIDRVIDKKHRDEYFLNVSVGIKGDPHVRKAVIDLKKCVGCAACFRACLHMAIKKAIKDGKTKYMVINERCIGCGLCEKACRFRAVSFRHEKKDLNTVLPPLIKLGLAAIELHAISDDEEEAFKEWQTITKHFPGILSLCLDRSHLGDVYLINRLKRFIEGRGNYTTIIQADGSPMSGSNDNYNTTLQTIATADVVQKANLPVWILMSGGTNSNTTKLAKMMGVKAHGVSIGSYARKIIDPLIQQDNFLEDKKIFNEAYLIARKLVNKSLRYL